jgi:cell fate regulator YaaT (PSP1 superfamily)
MPTVIGVRFRTSPKVYFFGPGEHTDLTPDDYVIVETTRGQEAGIVAFGACEVDAGLIPGTLKDIVRAATALDLTTMERYLQREERALEVCMEKVEESGLPMKVIRADYSYDGSHLTFYFTADKRVDFRALVKELAREFRTRIELRQVGVRDEVKLIGGYGMCGREHCCTSWLPEFRPISIRMAKQQNLPLSPMEISGVCGRLLCCLSYENDYYGEAKRSMPRVGHTLQTPQGEGKVTAVNVIKETVTVQISAETTITVKMSELEQESQEQDQARDTSRRRRSRR